MKTLITSALLSMLISGLTTIAQAENANQMNMESTMQDCMKTHKDHNQCHQEHMKSCELKMGKKECAQMMKNMKPIKMNHKK